MKKKFAEFLCMVMMFLCLITPMAVSAADSDIIIPDANVIVNPIDGWINFTRDKMDSDDLNKISALKEQQLNKYKNENIYFDSYNSSTNMEIVVASVSDKLSEDIFDMNEAGYTKQREYIDSIADRKVLANVTITVTNSSEKYKNDQALFCIVEYKCVSKTLNVTGICYTTIINGKYVTVDLRSKTGEISKAARAELLDFVSGVRFIEVNEKEKLTVKQIIIIACGAAAIIGFITLITISQKHKKKY